MNEDSVGETMVDEDEQMRMREATNKEVAAEERHKEERDSGHGGGSAGNVGVPKKRPRPKTYSKVDEPTVEPTVEPKGTVGIHMKLEGVLQRRKRQREMIRGAAAEDPDEQRDGLTEEDHQELLWQVVASGAEQLRTEFLQTLQQQEQQQHLEQEIEWVD